MARPIRSSVTSATIPSFISTSTRLQLRATRCSTTVAPARRSAARCPALPRRRRSGKHGKGSCSISSARTSRTARCRRCPGSRGPPAIQSIQTGRSTTAPGTSPRSSTSWSRTPRCSARPSSSSTTMRPTGASTTSHRRSRRSRLRSAPPLSISTTRSLRPTPP